MFSDTVMAHFSSPHNVGQLEAPDAVGMAGTPGRGNYMVLHLRLDGERITQCAYLTFGCPPAIAAGSVLTEMIKGQTVSTAMDISPQQLEAALGGLPLGRKHCAVLAIDALHHALSPLIGQDSTRRAGGTDTVEGSALEAPADDHQSDQGDDTPWTPPS